jgi:hypothetical protein
MGILRTDVISHSQLSNGNASVLFDGTTDSITIPSHSAFAFGTADWTVEMFVNFTSLSGQQTLVGDTYGNTAGWYLYKQNNHRLGVYYSSIVVDGNTLIEADRWYHLAFVRHSGRTSIYIDGELDAEGADTTNATTTQYYIGDTADSSSGELFGYMSNLRITRTAVYTTEFTVPKFKLKEVPGTILLTLQSSSSTTEAAVSVAGTLTANGDPTATAFGPGLKEDITDSGVVFDGVTNFDSLAYFTPPSGKTTQRNRGRAIFAGGVASPYKDIQVVDISSGGIAQDFGDTTSAAPNNGSASSSTRMLVTIGGTPAVSNIIEFITIANIANSTDFGDLTEPRRRTQSLSNSTRAVHVGGTSASPASLYRNEIDFNTIATAGNATDFGDTLAAHVATGGSVASSTRGVYSVGYLNGSYVNTLEFITIASTGNGQDFGDLNGGTIGYHFRGSTCDSTRGLFSGGYNPSAEVQNKIDFITIATTGNATDFGDLSLARRSGGGTSNSIHSIFAGGYLPGVNNTIDRVLIQTTGNAVDFGDFVVKTHENSGSSDSHGGLE